MFDGFVVDFNNQLFVSGAIVGSAMSCFLTSIVFLTYYMCHWKPIKRRARRSHRIGTGVRRRNG